MKILAIGDPHGKLPKNLTGIIKKNKIEVIICIGEIYPIFRHKDGSGDADLKGGEKVLHKLCSYNLPMILFKGNMFPEGQGLKYFRNLLKRFRKKYKNLYYKKLGKLTIKKKIFVIFDMIYEIHAGASLYRRWGGYERNNKRLEKLIRLLKENKKAVLLSHAPPYGYVDKVTSGEHTVSKVLLKAIRKRQPKLVLCGHIHEAKGRAKIGKSIVYNLGCCGDYKVMKI